MGKSKKKKNGSKDKKKPKKDNKMKGKPSVSSSSLVSKSASKKKKKDRKSKKKKTDNVPSGDVAANNQRQIDMIVKLLEDIQSDRVTQHNKHDLDLIQTMIKNICYRDAGEMKRVRPLGKFSSEQQMVILKVVGLKENGDSSADDSSLCIGDHGPKIKFPFKKLTLVPTARTPKQKK